MDALQDLALALARGIPADRRTADHVDEHASLLDAATRAELVRRVDELRPPARPEHLSRETLETLAWAADFAASESTTEDRAGRCSAHLRRAAAAARAALDELEDPSLSEGGGEGSYNRVVGGPPC